MSHVKQLETVSPKEPVMQTADSLTQQFTPNDVFLNTVPPLTATMGKAEAEAAAAMLVRAMQVRGNAWAVVFPKQIGEVLSADLDGKVEPWASLNGNPFFRPDFDLLIAKGCARWVGDESEGRSRGIEFTPEGIEKLRRWVRLEKPAVQP